MAGPSRDVLMAAVIGAQGLKGEVKVKTFTATPEAVGAYGPLHTKDGRCFTVIAARAGKNGEAVLSLAGVSDRSAAEALKGVELYVPRAALPATEGEEFYHADLIGLRAEDVEDRVLGTVKAIHNYGAGDVIEIEQPGRRLHSARLHARDRAAHRARKGPHRDRRAARRRRARAQLRRMTWSATVLTLFPEMFPGPLGLSLLGKALQKNIWSLDVRDIRGHGIGKHRTVDDTPAGGGPGMVMRADVALAAIDAVPREGRPLIYLSPRGLPLTQKRVTELAAGPGRDPALRPVRGDRPAGHRRPRIEEVSLGDFVLAGGEIAAMALVEAAVRLIPGVLGDAESPHRGELRPGIAGISAIHPAAGGRRADHPGRPKQRKSQGNRQMAVGPRRKA